MTAKTDKEKLFKIIALLKKNYIIFEFSIGTIKIKNQFVPSEIIRAVYRMGLGCFYSSFGKLIIWDAGAH